MATNRKIGNSFETEFCELLFQHGFWCHNMAQNAAGQPADVIAVKGKTAYLIFLGKNNYGYQDKTEYVLTPNQQNDNDYSADEIRERYIASDQQKRLSDGSSDEDTSD